MPSTAKNRHKTRKTIFNLLTKKEHATHFQSNANYIVKGFTSRTGTLKSKSSTSSSSSYTFTKGQKLRVVLVFGKSDDVSITSSSNMDNIDVNVLNSNGTVVASSTSSRNNVEIIEYTIPADGSYSVQAKAVTVRNTTNGVPFSVCWMAI